MLQILLLTAKYGPVSLIRNPMPRIPDFQNYVCIDFYTYRMDEGLFY